MDERYTCDQCGKEVLHEGQVPDADGMYLGPWSPDGWVYITGDWRNSADFCSFACMEAWLSTGGWKPFVDAQRATYRQYAIDHPDRAAKAGDA